MPSTRPHPQLELPRVWLRSEARDCGYSDRAIQQLVASQEWSRVRRGAYVEGAGWRALSDVEKHGVLARAAYRQAQADVVVSHLSALPFYEAPMWEMDLDVVHLTRDDGRAGRAERGVHQHVGRLLDGDVVDLSGLRVTSATRTGLDVSMQASLDASVGVFDHLLHRGLTTPEQLRDRYAGMVNWPGSLNTDLALRLSDGRAESLGETFTRLLCWREHLPTPVPQVPIHDHTGRIVAWVDLAWPEFKVFLEFDGRVKYEKFRRPGESALDAILREKAREQMVVELKGWRPIRLVWADLFMRRATAARIHRMLFPPGPVR